MLQMRKPKNKKKLLEVNRKILYQENKEKYGVYTCEICKKAPLIFKPQAYFEGHRKELLHQRMTLDHIIPKSRGGQNWTYNLQVACHECNSKKGNTVPEAHG